MKIFFKNSFKTKRSQVSFNSTTQIFEIVDNAKSQKGFVYAMGFIQLVFAGLEFLKSNYSDYSYLALFVFFLVTLMVHFLLFSQASKISLKEIGYLIYRKSSSNATVVVKLKMEG